MLRNGFLRHCLRRIRAGAIKSTYLEETDDDVLVAIRGAVDPGAMAPELRGGLMLAWLNAGSETHRGPGISEGPATRQSGSKTPTSIDSPNEANASFTHSSRSTIGSDAAASAEKTRRPASNMMTLCPRAERKRRSVRRRADKCSTTRQGIKYLFNRHSSVNPRRDQSEFFKTGVPKARLIFILGCRSVDKCQTMVLVCIP